jgi:quercetin dioxygenase-like cupin family protein
MKHTLRLALAGIAIFLASVSIGHAQPQAVQAAGREEVLYQRTLDGKPPRDLVLMTVEYAPGAGDAPHLHPGYTFVYVTAGEMASQLDGQRKRVYRTGESWVEEPYEHHVICRNESTVKSAKILVLFILDHGAKSTIDLPAAGDK